MLTKFEKSLERDMHSDFIAKGGEVFSFPEMGVTVAMCEVFPNSKTVNVAVSVKSNEDRFDLATGRYHALYHFDGMEFLTVRRPKSSSIFAEMLVETLCE